MQKNKIVYLPARGRIYESAVEDTAVDMLDDYEEEIAAILSTPLDPDWHPSKFDPICEGLSELVGKYLENAFISEKYVLPDDETIRSAFISDVVVAVREFREWQYREVQEEEEDKKEEAP